MKTRQMAGVVVLLVLFTAVSTTGCATFTRGSEGKKFAQLPDKPKYERLTLHAMAKDIIAQKGVWGFDDILGYLKSKLDRKDKLPFPDWMYDAGNNLEILKFRSAKTGKLKIAIPVIGMQQNTKEGVLMNVYLKNGKIANVEVGRVTTLDKEGMLTSNEAVLLGAAGAASFLLAP